MGAAVAPPGEQDRIVLESVQRAPDQVVEVQAAALGDRRLVGDEGPRERAGVGVGRDRGRRRGEVELESGEGGVEAPDLGGGDVRPELGR